MKPIYFPFTYISEPVLEALQTCFESIVMYTISEKELPENMRSWAKEGVIDIRTPVKMDEQKFNAILKDYRTWADRYKVDDIAHLKNHGRLTPFFDDEAINQIKKDIGQSRTELHPSGDRIQEKTDPLVIAGMFLVATGEYDMQTNEISSDLLAFDMMEKDLIDNMKGEDDPIFSRISSHHHIPLSEDTGSFMTSERVAAWTHIMQYDQEASGLFITHSRAVFDHVMDHNSEAEKVLHVDGIPLDRNRGEDVVAWRVHLMNYLETLLHSTWPVSEKFTEGIPKVDETVNIASLILNIVPGKIPRECFASLARYDMLSFKEERSSVLPKHTLIGLLDITSHI